MKTGIHFRNSFLLLALILVLAAAQSCKDPEVLVTKITFQPDHVEVFVDDFSRISVSTFPHFADNEDELTFTVTDPTIAQSDGSSVVGLKEGRTELIAECGYASTICPIRVYQWGMTLNGKDYGVGDIEVTRTQAPKETEILFSHEDNGESQHIYIRMKNELFGTPVYFTDDVAGAYAAAYYNNYEDGYTICSMNSGKPLVLDAKWAKTSGVSVITGYCWVRQLDDGQYTVKADVQLTNGFSFFIDWKGRLR